MKKDLFPEEKQQTPLQIGVTGGIGTGKSTVCKIFESIGIPIYNADDRAKNIMIDNPEVKKRIVDLLGEESYFENGQLNRTFIAKVVFSDADKLKILNSIVHPAVREDGEKWHHSQIGSPYTIKEAALMIESGNYKTLDRLILVTAPDELRIKRVMDRDNASKIEVLSRIEKQMPEADKKAFADFIINNDGSESLVKQVYAIHQMLKFLALSRLS